MPNLLAETPADSKEYTPEEKKSTSTVFFRYWQPDNLEDTFQRRKFWKMASHYGALADSHGEAIFSEQALLSSTIWGESYQERFKRLKEEWKQDTAHLASPFEKAQHPAYQSIIGMGLPVVPIMLEDLRDGPEHWFWALKAITGTNPVSEEHEGNPRQMAEDWIEWGESTNLLDDLRPTTPSIANERFGKPLPEPARYIVQGDQPRD